MPNAGPLHPGDPRQAGEYRLTGRIGEGGQGVVFQGESLHGGERVAVKLLRGGPWTDELARRRFMREAEIAMRVAQFCTARILAAGVIDDRPYIVSEYIDGPTLQRRVASEGVLSGGALERLAIGTATALTAIHQAGIVHRDLKPGNVLLGPDGPRVIDFGIARPVDTALTATGQTVGTPAYMAPERFSGAPAGPAGPAADVFAWAATVTFAATGRPPFGNDAIPSVLNRVLNEQPDLNGLPDPLRDLVERCLAKDPARRPSAQQVLLQLLGDHTPIPVVAMPSAAGTVPTAQRAATRPSRGRRLLIPAAVAAAIASAYVLAWAPFGGEDTARARTPAPSRASVSVPDLTGLSKDNADDELRDAGLTMGKVTNDCTAAHPGKVTHSSPRAGTTTSPNGTVDVTLAATPVKVLDAKGWPIDQARRTLEKNGLTTRLTYKQRDYWLGKVVTQDPPAGSHACPGSKVVLSVGITRP
jgi:eukaryotic-like serine/threonine-protein kinase